MMNDITAFFAFLKYCLGNKDCVRNRENGYLLPLDADAYANKIIQLVNDKELRTSMEEKSRALFLEEFFIENRIKYLQNQYNMVYNLRYGGGKSCPPKD